MGAVPKKKLCWNCDGNVSKHIDNCPYCGVYLHSIESEENSLWNPSYRFSTSKADSVPAAPYQHASQDDSEADNESDSPVDESALYNYDSLQTIASVFYKFKKDVLPILLLMAGSWLFLFSTILFLFAEQGTLTLQWKSDYWIYFLFISIPSLFLGWKFLQQAEPSSTVD